MKLRIQNTDEELSVRVGTRNTQNGADGHTIEVAPGETAEVEISDAAHLFAAPVGASRPEQGTFVGTPTIVDGKSTSGDDSADSTTEPAPELLVADDAQVSAIMKEMLDSQQNLTKKGVPELPVVNARLNAAGFQNIDGARRDALFEPMNPSAT